MNMLRFYGMLHFLILIVSIQSVFAGEQGDSTSADKKKGFWKQIAPYFEPPDEFKGNLGKYKSPLKFYDGRPVKTPADWQMRRQEILKTWHTMMGEWPAVNENPQVEYLKEEHRDNFSQYTVRFNIAPGHPNTGYLLIPDRAKQNRSTPAVLVVFYDPETGVGLKGENRDFAYQLAKRGFVTFSVGHDYSLYYPNRENAQIQPLSALAYGAANAFHVLANRKEVDPKRIGIVGHSYGGKWAMFASCLYDKFACAAWSDGGIVFDENRPSVNYWEPWYLGYAGPNFRKRGLPTKENPRTGLYKKLIKEGYDLHELHALMAPRPFLVSGGSEDQPKQWRALNHTVAVNRFLGYKNRVAMTNREKHAPNPKSNEQMYQFFEYWLKKNQLSAN
ncbi:prolyl oligopeptidase family serine peptidase [Gimesia aquarii]|uniref:Alpha/beta hydrolase family protein n=1 Tax=Gimesia aquarii TaxID=2527964 RepID=A0A517X1R6_9PLAN|nr:prolyl oligopeptidase family serine peptidase [Gimesia aquarii]QDU11446.1 Alpha/beta hydrolase family protein [Gimesia aquarii]